MGADGRRPARGSRPPASTCGCRQLSRARADAVAARVRRRRRRSRWSARTSSPNVRWSAVFDDVELTAADIARLAKEARPLIRSGGRWVAIDRADLQGRGRGARRTRRRRTQLSGAEMLRLALGLEGSPLARRRSRSKAGAGRPICSRPRPTSPPNRPQHADGLRRRAAQLPGRSARVARLPRLGRARWLPRARHGSRQDADDARAPARRRGRRARARDRAARGRRQLDRGSRALHARACASSCTTARTAPRPTRSRPRSPTPTSSSPRTAPRCATSRRIAEVEWARGRSSTRRRRSRTRPTTRRSSCAASRRARASRSPARRSRTASATCGRSSTSRIPGLVGTASAVHRAPLERRRRDARRRRGRDARAQRHPRVPPHQGRARDRGRAARPDRRARPLRDDARADRPVPGACSTRSSPAPTLPRATKPRKGQILAAITALKQICNHPSAYQHDDRPLAGRSGKLARLEEIVDAVFAAGETRARVHALRGVGRASSPSTSPSAPARRSPVTTAGCRAPRVTTIIDDFQDGDGAGRARAVAEGGRHRLEPHRREPRRALRPLVEPRGRRPGARPCVAHRPDAHGHLPPPDLPRHRRRARRGSRRRQAPHRRPRACRSRARSPTSTAHSCGPRSGSVPTRCSPTTRKARDV